MYTRTEPQKLVSVICISLWCDIEATSLLNISLYGSGLWKDLFKLYLLQFTVYILVQCSRCSINYHKKPLQITSKSKKYDVPFLLGGTDDNYNSDYHSPW